MEESKNQGQPAAGSVPENKPEEKGDVNTPNYPIADGSRGEADLGDNPGLRTVVRTLIIIVIIVAAVWFFNRGEDKNKNGNVLGEGENANTETNQNIDSNINGQVITGGVTQIEKTKVSAFYAKAGETDCRQVFKIEREIEKKYDQELVNTLRGLLTPLTSEEVKAGYVSYIPSGTYLNNVKVDGEGLATVKFNSKLNQVSDACAVTAARAQIEQTLLQFPYVKSVIICAGENCDQGSILN